MLSVGIGEYSGFFGQLRYLSGFFDELCTSSLFPNCSILDLSSKRFKGASFRG
jgi:hypothetical protein